MTGFSVLYFNPCFSLAEFERMSTNPDPDELFLNFTVTPQPPGTHFYMDFLVETSDIKVRVDQVPCKCFGDRNLFFSEPAYELYYYLKPNTPAFSALCKRGLARFEFTFLGRTVPDEVAFRERNIDPEITQLGLVATEPPHPLENLVSN